jgi:hypothetical protein
LRIEKEMKRNCQDFADLIKQLKILFHDTLTNCISFNPLNGIKPVEMSEKKFYKKLRKMMILKKESNTSLNEIYDN